MTRFYLIRHGETEWNVTGRWQGHADVALNKIGKEQARRLAARLRDERVCFHALYSSDLQRAWVTAQAVAQALDIQPRPLTALREIDLGHWRGKTRAEIVTYDSAALARIDAGEDLPRGGAERMADLYIRVVGAIEKLADAHPGQTIGVVTHGGPVRMLLAHALFNRVKRASVRQADAALDLGAAAQAIANARWEHIGNTSITIITRTSAGWDVGAVNDMSHLEAGTQARDLMSAPPDDAQQA